MEGPERRRPELPAGMPAPAAVGPLIGRHSSDGSLVGRQASDVSLVGRQSSIELRAAPERWDDRSPGSRRPLRRQEPSDSGSQRSVLTDRPVSLDRGSSIHGFRPARRPSPTRSGMPSLTEIHGHDPRSGQAQIRGLYLVKFAASVTASYLTIQLMISFAEVLLPFIFAVLCLIILEPLKKFVMRVLQRLAVLLLQCLGQSCLAQPESRGEEGDRSEGETAVMYGSLPQDSSEEPPLRPVPMPAVKKFILAVSILFCMLITGRVVWLTAKVFLHAGYLISGNLNHYRKGSARLKTWFQAWISDMHMEALDYGDLVDGLVLEVENIGTVVTQNVLYTALQAVVTFIFLIYMLWSPIRVESSSMTQEVFISTSRYLKVKCLISAFTGLSVALLLWVIGLDLPAAFGLLSFLANFLPGIGSIVASTLPCILAAIDVRKTPTQVLVAFVGQLAVHFCIDFVMEPVFFGMSVEIHSVIVILGIWFFYQVWGVPGMLLSVPLLAVMRIMMRSMRNANRLGAASGEDVDTIIFLDNILEGRWMSSLGGGDAVAIEMPEISLSLKEASGEVVECDATRSLNFPPKEASGEVVESGATRLDGVDTWAVLCDSDLGREACQIYHSHRLLFDALLLLGIMAAAVIL